MSSDPFGTAALRSAVLDAWSAAPHRFREDANAEESLTVGGYRDRVLVELIANAVDAAAAAGEPARVLVEFDGDELRVANNGAPLTAAGVIGLASLRASAKQGGDEVGHFGVGFTAVLAVSDAPVVLSRTGGVRFDRARTAAAVAALHSPELDALVRARSGSVPVLRLPWPDTELPPADWTTQVRLPVRPEARAQVWQLLDSLGPALFWALPGLVEVTVAAADTVTWRREEGPDGLVRIRAGDRVETYRLAGAEGRLPPELLRGRPVEERRRSHWRVGWAHRLEGDPPDRVAIGAPTPTDDEIAFPATLIGTFPVDDTRRRIADGALTDFLVEQAVRAYLTLVLATEPQDRLDLLPGNGFPLGSLDGALRTGVIRELAGAPILRTAAGDPVAPADAVAIPGLGDAAELVVQALPALVPLSGSARQLDLLRRLGVQVLPVSAASGALGGLDRGPGFWRELYTRLADQDAEELADLPVPLAAGGRRIGARNALLPSDLDPQLLARISALAPTLPIVHPAAVHPLLRRLGARPADAAALVAEPVLLERYRDFRERLEDADPDPAELTELAEVALTLAAAGGRGGLLEHVVLTDDEDNAWPAAELLDPDAPFARLLAADADLPPVGPRWSAGDRQALQAVGVRYGLPVVPVTGPDDELPDVERWWEEAVGEQPPPADLWAIADLDLIDQEAWPAALDLVAGDRAARDALGGPVSPSYTGWWLARFARLAGRPLGHYRLPGAADLAGLYPELPIALDPAVAVAVGVLDGLPAAAREPGELLRRYADPELAVPPVAVPELTGTVLRLLAAAPELELPRRIRTLAGTAADPFAVLVLDQPWVAQLLPADRLVPAVREPRLVAELLDLDLATDILGDPEPAGEVVPGDCPGVAEAAAALGVSPSPVSLVPELAVSGTRVAWWVHAGRCLVDGSAAGVGRAAAWAAGRWADRSLAVAAAAGDVLVMAENGSSGGW